MFNATSLYFLNHGQKSVKNILGKLTTKSGPSVNDASGPLECCGSQKPQNITPSTFGWLKI